MNPGLNAGLRLHPIPVVEANDANFADFGAIVADINSVSVEIVRWPAQGWRPIDTDSGDEAGTTEGIFEARWDGDILFGVNAAVSGNYVLAYGCPPEDAKTGHQRSPKRMLLWHANYHPDGGQLFFPQEERDYFVPLALPGDDVGPEDFICFKVPGDRGCYIHPNIWHEGIFPLHGSQRFFDRQGRVHARVSVDFAREFECLLEVSIA